MSELDGHDGLDALFLAERGFEEVPRDDVKLRLRHALAARLTPQPGGSQDPERPRDQDPQDPQAPQLTTGAPAAVGRSIASRAIPLSRAIAGMVATFTVGAVTGAVAVHEAAPTAKVEPPTQIASARGAPVVVPAAPSSPTNEPLPDPVPPGALPPAPSAAVRAPVASDEHMAAERALLDAARVALADGEPVEAISLVERHAREFPRGRLVEEREALAVRAFVKAGRYEEARAKGAAFNAKWPHSLARPAVEAALESIP